MLRQKPTYNSNIMQNTELETRTPSSSAICLLTWHSITDGAILEHCCHYGDFQNTSTQLLFRYHAYGLHNRGSIFSTEFLLFPITSRSMHRALRIFPTNIVDYFSGRKAAAGSRPPFTSIYEPWSYVYYMSSWRSVLYYDRTLISKKTGYGLDDRCSIFLFATASRLALQHVQIMHADCSFRENKMAGALCWPITSIWRRTSECIKVLTLQSTVSYCRYTRMCEML